MEKYQQANLALWNEWAAINAQSEMYDLASFKAGKCALKPIELQELGDVTGKTLLHLQCHFGLDTLSWARRGARVTGADFSDEAISLAKSLSRELDIPADFVCSDIYNLPQVLSGQFDVVFTSYGVLCWLRDLVRWAEIVAHFLKPGGTFYIVEFHPFAWVFDDEHPTELRVKYDYFHTPEPTEWTVQGSYADRNAHVKQPVEYEWAHSLGDILNALIAAGLRIEFLHEFPYSVERTFPFMERDPDSWWRLQGSPAQIPLTFSLKVIKV